MYCCSTKTEKMVIFFYGVWLDLPQILMGGGTLNSSWKVLNKTVECKEVVRREKNLYVAGIESTWTISATHFLGKPCNKSKFPQCIFFEGWEIRVPHLLLLTTPEVVGFSEMSENGRQAELQREARGQRRRRAREAGR